MEIILIQRLLTAFLTRTCGKGMVANENIDGPLCTDSMLGWVASFSIRSMKIYLYTFRIVKVFQ